MKELWRFIWTGQWCQHKWEVVKTQEVYDAYDKSNKMNTDDLIPIGSNIILKCTKCGDWTSRRV